MFSVRKEVPYLKGHMPTTLIFVLGNSLNRGRDIGKHLGIKMLPGLFNT